MNKELWDKIEKEVENLSDWQKQQFEDYFTPKSQPWPKNKMKSYDSNSDELMYLRHHSDFLEKRLREAKEALLAVLIAVGYPVRVSDTIRATIGSDDVIIVSRDALTGDSIFSARRNEKT